MRNFTEAELRVLSRLHTLGRKHESIRKETFSKMLRKLMEDITKWYNLQDKRTIPIYINRELVCETYVTNRLMSLHFDSPYYNKEDRTLKIKDCIEIVNILHTLLEIPFSEE